MDNKKEFLFMKKHLLLLNRLVREQFKKHIIKTPSKLSFEETKILFDGLFKKNDKHYEPVNEIKVIINTEPFKLIKNPAHSAKEIKEAKKDKKLEDMKRFLKGYKPMNRAYLRQMEEKKAKEEAKKAKAEI